MKEIYNRAISKRLANQKYKNDIFYRFTLSYILLIVFLSVFFLYSYRYSYSMLKNQIQTSNLVALQYSIGIMDQKIEQVDRAISLMSDDIAINAALDISIPIADPEYLQYKGSIENINRFMQNQSLSEKGDIFLYVKNSEKILTSLTMYSPESYYNLILKYPLKFYNGWKKILNEDYYKGTALNEASPVYAYDKDNIFYIRSIPYSYFKQISGTVVVPIKRDMLAHEFSAANVSGKASVYILDEQGNKITDIFGSDKTERGYTFENPEGYADITGIDEKYFVTYATSMLNGWKYVCAVPESVVYERLYRYRRFSYMFLFATLGFGVIISILLAYRNSKPIMNIGSQLEKVLEPTEIKTVSFSEISGGINTLIEKNITLSEDIKNNVPIIMDNFINNIFKGRIRDRDEFDAFTKYLDIDLNFESFGVLVISISSYPDDKEDNGASVWESELKSVLAYFFGIDAIIHALDYKTIGIIKNYAGSDFEAYCRAKSEALSLELNTRLGIKVIASAAGLCSDPLDIWHTFDQAELALGYVSDSNAFVWYDNIFMESEIYYYPLDFEKRLMEFVKEGDKSQVERLLNVLSDENFRIRKLSHKMKKELYLELKGTLNKIIADIRDPQAGMTYIYDKEDMPVIREYFLKACDMFLSHEDEPRKSVINEAMRYINENYNDSDLGLYKIATNFKLSEGYFSVMFKMQTGMNFTEYLEKIRVTKALELVKDTHESIDDIAQMVGYNSSQTLRRAFKKAYGETPTAMRK